MVCPPTVRSGAGFSIKLSYLCVYLSRQKKVPIKFNKIIVPGDIELTYFSHRKTPVQIKDRSKMTTVRTRKSSTWKRTLRSHQRNPNTFTKLKRAQKMYADPQLYRNDSTHCRRRKGEGVPRPTNRHCVKIKNPANWTHS